MLLDRRQSNRTSKMTGVAAWMMGLALVAFFGITQGGCNTQTHSKTLMPARPREPKKHRAEGMLICDLPDPVHLAWRRVGPPARAIRVEHDSLAHSYSCRILVALLVCSCVADVHDYLHPSWRSAERAVVAPIMPADTSGPTCHRLRWSLGACCRCAAKLRDFEWDHDKYNEPQLMNTGYFVN